MLKSIMGKNLSITGRGLAATILLYIYNYMIYRGYAAARYVARSIISNNVMVQPEQVKL